MRLAREGMLVSNLGAFDMSEGLLVAGLGLRWEEYKKLTPAA